MPNVDALYIISNYKFAKHFSLSKAQKERERLSQKHPDEVFRIYKVFPGILKDGTPAPTNKPYNKKKDYRNPPDLKGPTKRPILKLKSKV